MSDDQCYSYNAKMKKFIPQFQVMVKLYAVFSHAINFIAVYDEASDVLKRHEIVKRDRELKIRTNTDKGGPQAVILFFNSS